MITFSNGHKLTFACGSGALAFDGRGWWWEWPLRWMGLLNPNDPDLTIVAKTVTRKPLKGNLSLWHPWTCVRKINDPYRLNGGKPSATNAIGLTNPGVHHWIKNDYPTAVKKGYKIAVSIKPENRLDADIMGSHLADLDELCYIEVNWSCPNVSENTTDIVEVLKALQSRHPLVLKLSISQVCEEFITRTSPYVEAYHAINTIPWDDIRTNCISPIQKYPHGLKGGVSGGLIHWKALGTIRSIKNWTNRPVIGGGGIFEIDDVYRFKHAGADAFSIGSCFLFYPWRPRKIIQTYRDTQPQL